MKFCKNLQRLVDISDPEWAPYWINYKMLKKLVKELPSLNSSDSKKTSRNSKHCSGDFSSTSHSNTMINMCDQLTKHNDGLSESDDGLNKYPSSRRKMPSSENTLQQMLENDTVFQTRAEVVRNLSVSKTTTCTPSTDSGNSSKLAKTIGGEPTEVAFFKLLHSEVKKGAHFFAKAEQEFTIREERIREGAEIVKNSSRTMSSDRWSAVAKSLYRLYKDLLLLETYAVMSYCSFSKILKKHDKVTGHNTRKAFMSNVVAKTNFSNYPNLLKMISRCESLYEEISKFLAPEGKECLQEDERLFINMILCLNEQVIDVADEEDVPITSEQKEKNKKSVIATAIRSRSNSSSPTQGRAISSRKAKSNQLTTRTELNVKNSKRSQPEHPECNASKMKRFRNDNQDA